MTMRSIEAQREYEEESRDEFNAEVEQLVLNISHVLHDKELSICMASLAAVLVTVAKQLPLNDDEVNPTGLVADLDNFIDPRENCMLAVLSAAWDSNVITPTLNLQ